MKKRVVSGAQATGNFHLGNLLGALQNWVKLQHKYECFFFLADLHAITVDNDPLKIRTSTLETAAIYLAAGLDPSKVNIFAQSSVKEHAELAWLLNCSTPLGWLKRMTQFKDKAGAAQESACLGLFSYPVLMAADILLYDADLVPVGEDQKQHLELTRDIAGAINRKFDAKIFNIPEPLIPGTAARIMSLTDGSRKMSKSDISDQSRINLSDNAEQISQKIKRAKTDNIREITYSPERPEIFNLINIFSAISGLSVEQIVSKYHDQGFAKFKNDLSEVVNNELAPINEKFRYLMNNQDYLINILREGSKKARLIAEAKMNKLKDLYGFVNVVL